jgi:hypothetical protein
MPAASRQARPAHGPHDCGPGGTTEHCRYLPGASAADLIKQPSTGLAAKYCCRVADSAPGTGKLSAFDIFRGDVRRGTAKRFMDAPDGRNAAGMAFDRRQHLLFVAGGPTGQAYPYQGHCQVVPVRASGSAFINDDALTRHGAWFTDSLQLYNQCQ